MDLTEKINPWYDEQGNAFSVVYPNSFNNMSSAVVKQIGYANQGALPAWMTSTQENGKPLGIKYTKLTAYLIESIKSLKEEIMERIKGDK